LSSPLVCSLGLICTTLVSNAAATITTSSQMITRQDRHSRTHDIHVQRVDSGAEQRTADGIAVCTAVNDQEYLQLVSDRSAGDIIIWQDHRVGNSDIYAQKMEPTGSPAIAATSVRVMLASTATSLTKTSPIPITPTFSQAVTGFAVGDITIGNGTAGNHMAVSGTV
jgi:hypothetical protein